MELDKDFVKSEILTIPGVREGIRNNDYDKVFELCKSIKKKQQLAMSLYAAKINFLKYMTSIPESLFRGAENLSDITIPGNIKEIGDLAFFGSSLNEVNFEEGLEKIGAGAFSQTKIKQVNLPKSVNHLGQSALGKAEVYCFLTKDDLGKSEFSFGDFTVNDIISSETGEVFNERS